MNEYHHRTIPQGVHQLPTEQLYIMATNGRVWVEQSHLGNNRIFTILWQLWFSSENDFQSPPVQNGNDISEANSNTLSQNMNEIFEQMKTEMSRAQSIQVEQAEKCHWKGVKLKVGARVWMDTRNILTQRPRRKLDWKHLGPYKVSEVVSLWAYQLNLPKNLHIHPVQSIVHLGKVSEDPLPGQVE
jgi:hypothetical protein